VEVKNRGMVERYTRREGEREGQRRRRREFTGLHPKGKPSRLSETNNNVIIKPRSRH